MGKQNEIEIDLGVLFLYLLKKIKVIAFGTLLFLVTALIVSSIFLPVQYTATTRVYVLNRDTGNDVSYSDYQVANQMIEDYRVLITGVNVTKEVIQQLKLEMTEEDLEKMIQIEVLKNTRILQIGVEDIDPVRAANIANCVREVASAQIKDIMDVEAVNLIYEAETPMEPSGPNVVKITLLTAAAGMFLIVVYYGFVCVMDDAIRTEEDVETYLNLSVLSVIPNSDVLEKRDDSRDKAEFKKNAGIKRKC